MKTIIRTIQTILKKIRPEKKNNGRVLNGKVTSIEETAMPESYRKADAYLDIYPAEAFPPKFK